MHLRLIFKKRGPTLAICCTAILTYVIHFYTYDCAITMMLLILLCLIALSNGQTRTDKCRSDFHILQTTDYSPKTCTLSVMSGNPCERRSNSHLEKDM